MSVIRLQQITPRSLENKMVGYQRAKQDAWERMRLQTWLSLSPYMDAKAKAGGVQKFMPFQWDGADVETDWERLRKHAEAERRKSQEQWALIDKSKKQ